ncbi:hypothetical protein EYF80_063379 [Liparis tanakae]|uniref:Uncharacterized protein n=1 Tax=Liparis tanakae TaxID=230148 RepID=A0A4Z2ED99_9TELE|nr:hypothetical protein EYF80_063379 [Liparis tanakae]
MSSAPTAFKRCVSEDGVFMESSGHQPAAPQNLLRSSGFPSRNSSVLTPSRSSGPAVNDDHVKEDKDFPCDVGAMGREG